MDLLGTSYNSLVINETMDEFDGKFCMPYICKLFFVLRDIFTSFFVYYFF